jgi:aspartyl-tRNA(Asn)/glutamyl-tRNA(Gln) amidotransferase subunit C
MEIDVKHVADLARVRLSPEEMQEMEKDLRGILSHIERLKEVPVDDVPPTFGPAKSAGLRLEEDAPKPGLHRDQVLKMAPATLDGNILVPKEAR